MLPSSNLLLPGTQLLNLVIHVADADLYRLYQRAAKKIDSQPSATSPVSSRFFGPIDAM